MKEIKEIKDDVSVLKEGQKETNQRLDRIETTIYEHDPQLIR